jgi:hypothetical protein
MQHKTWRSVLAPAISRSHTLRLLLAGIRKKSSLCTTSTDSFGRPKNPVSELQWTQSSSGVERIQLPSRYCPCGRRRAHWTFINFILSSIKRNLYNTTSSKFEIQLYEIGSIFLNDPVYGHNRLLARYDNTARDNYKKALQNILKHLMKIHISFETVRFQQSLAVNVRKGIIDDLLSGLYELRPRLSGNCYLQFLSESITQALDDVPMATRQTVWVLRDGARARASREFMRYLYSL